MYKVIIITCIRLLQLHVLGYYNYMYKVKTEQLKKIKQKKSVNIIIMTMFWRP